MEIVLLNQLKDCPSPCYYCGKGNSHNRCICPQKFVTSKVNSLSAAELGELSNREHPRSINNDQPGVTNSSTLTSTSTPTSLASQRTFMTDHLARQLNLKLEH